MAGTIVTDRIESDATYNSKIELASPVEVSNTFTATGGVNTNALSVAGNNIPNAGGMMFRNRIINGDMRIDQRNNGASVTVNGNTQFGVDRFFGEESTDGAFTLQRSTAAPSGFTNSLLATITTADTSLSATQLAIIGQRIEGFNVADLGWGTASAQTVTLSFWVRSSLTGTFGGAFWNSAGNRSYPYSYTISSANTWEYKTVVIAGETTGTWLTDNGRGINVAWSLGVGSDYQSTAGEWTNSLKLSTTGAVSVVGTNGATFYITGVQLEAGSVATPFERRPYGTELSLCQRYFEAQYFRDSGYGNGSNGIVFSVPMKVTKRASPTVSLGADPDGWIINFPSPTVAAYDIDSLAIRTATAPSAGLSRYGSILSISAEL